MTERSAVPSSEARMYGVFSNEVRFKGVNLAPKGEGVAGGDGYSSSQPARRLYGFIMLYGFNNPPQNLLMQK